MAESDWLPDAWAQPPVESSMYTTRSDGRTVKVPVEFTPERKDTFLEWYRKTGQLALSAQAAGVVSGTVSDHRKKDPLFDELCREAKEQHTDSLVLEAQRRAYAGVSKPIIGGKFKDEVITHVQEYSDRLMELLLKANREEFRGKDAATGAGSGGVLIIPGGPESIDDWEAQQGEAARGQTGKPSEEKQ